MGKELDASDVALVTKDDQSLQGQVPAELQRHTAVVSSGEQQHALASLNATEWLLSLLFGQDAVLELRSSDKRSCSCTSLLGLRQASPPQKDRIVPATPDELEEATDDDAGGDSEDSDEAETVDV